MTFSIRFNQRSRFLNRPTSCNLWTLTQSKWTIRLKWPRLRKTLTARHWVGKRIIFTYSMFQERRSKGVSSSWTSLKAGKGSLVKISRTIKDQRRTSIACSSWSSPTWLASAATCCLDEQVVLKSRKHHYLSSFKTHWAGRAMVLMTSIRRQQAK
jgi:hypothetical protein